MLRSSMLQARTPTSVSHSWLNLSGRQMQFWPIPKLARSFAAPDVTTFFAGFRTASSISPPQMNFVLSRRPISEGGLATGLAASSCWQRAVIEMPNASVSVDAPLRVFNSTTICGGAMQQERFSFPKARS